MHCTLMGSAVDCPFVITAFIWPANESVMGPAVLAISFPRDVLRVKLTSTEVKLPKTTACDKVTVKARVSRSAIRLSLLSSFHQRYLL